MSLSLFHFVLATARFLRTAFAFVSAVLFLGAVLLWVRSYFRSDSIEFHDGSMPTEHKRTLIISTNQLLFFFQSTVFFNIDPATGKEIPFGPGDSLADPSTPPHTWASNPPLPAGWYYGTSSPTFFDHLGFDWRSSHEPRSHLWTAPDHDSFPCEAESFEYQGSIPLWAPTTLLGLAPSFWLVRRLRRPNRPGLCTNCSYDLRAHRAGDKCPECGSPVPAIGQKVHTDSPATRR